MTKTEWKPDLCIYHGNCDDGFGAAWAIWKRWGNDVEFVPGVYGKPLPDVAGRNVLFVDFSAPYETLATMSWVARSLVVIDHHKTALADLARLPSFDGSLTGLDEAFKLCWSQNMPEIAASFDMEQSGAVMAWKFARPDKPVPEFLRYIEDRDLWRFSYGVDDATKQFSASLRTYEQEFNLWDKLAESTADLISHGAGILRAHQANIAKFIADAYVESIAGHIVPVVNVPYHYASDTAHALLAKYPEASFTACWFKRGDGMVQYSLRSEDHRLDVSEIAKRFGGGGHRNAAGYQVAP